MASGDLWEIPPSLPRTVMKKVSDITVMKALTEQIGDAIPEGYRIVELVPRPHENGWVVVMEPLGFHTPPAL